MGLSFRKSVRVGPFRFNFSKSGVGVSTGIKGFRIGTGPRGNYVSLGAMGLRYRYTLPAGSATPATRVQPGHRDPIPDLGQPLIMEEIESGAVSAMNDGSAAELLAELNGKRKKWRMFPTVIVLSSWLFFILYFSEAPAWLTITWIGLATLLSGWIYLNDQLRKTTVICYNLEPEIEPYYERFLQWFEQLEQCRRSWHISAKGDVHDAKYHAGANQLINRTQIQISRNGITELKTNLDIAVIPVGRQKLVFLPERLLVFDHNGVGAVSYADLMLTVRDSMFVESDPVPADATIVDRTWRYVNKRGGPDRRFKDNPEIPVCHYQTIHFQSATGLNEMIQISRTGIGEPFAKCITALAQLTSTSLDTKSTSKTPSPNQ